MILVTAKKLESLHHLHFLLSKHGVYGRLLSRQQLLNIMIKDADRMIGNDRRLWE